MVLDTNVLIDGFADDFSAQAKLLDAVRDGELVAVVTEAVRREYNKILRRLIDDPQYRERVDEFMAVADIVEPAWVEVELDDEDDRKFFKAALGGRASLIVTSDRHLLDVGELDGVRVVTPQEAWQTWQEEQGGGEWTEWAEGLLQ